MFVHPDDDPRSNGGFEGERATLVGYLRDQRLTLELKCRTQFFAANTVSNPAVATTVVTQ